MAESVIVEKRSEKRFPVDFVVMSQNEKKSDRSLAFIRDISKRGLKIQALQFPFDVGQKCCLEFYLDKDKPVQLNAEVRWTLESNKCSFYANHIKKR